MTATTIRSWAVRTTLMATLGSVALTGCGFKGAASLPLPGGKGGGGYKVTVEMNDVMDLVPQSAVKVDDVTVGRVEKIDVTNDYRAKIEFLVERDVKLPENVSVQMRQTSLLGEKFLSLDRPPADQARGTLGEGSIIPIEATRRNAEVEEVLSALSLVLNGGGLEQLQTINSEVTKALKGREGEVKSLLRQLNTFVGGLDAQKGDIVRLLDSLDRLTKKLADNRQTIQVALRDIPGGLRVLTQQEDRLVKVLTELDRLGTVATRVIRASKDETVESLRALEPILTQLNRAGNDLPTALELLVTYPFPKTVVNGVYGDYANLFISLQLTPPPSQGPPITDPTAELCRRQPALPICRTGTPGITPPSGANPLGGVTGRLSSGESDYWSTMLFGGLT